MALFFRLHLFFRDRYYLIMLRVSFSQLHNKYFWDLGAQQSRRI